MAQSRSRKVSKYDIHTTCPICGEPVDWLNGETNSALEYIKTKRRTESIYHKVCIEKLRRAYHEGHNIQKHWDERRI